MNEKEQRIDLFLKRLRDIVQQNPGFDLNKNIIYSELIRLGVPENEKKLDVSAVGLFDYWTNFFAKYENINVFVSKSWKYFCQFVNKNDAILDSKEHIKMYIPLDSNHLAVGAVKIFDFLSKNNIAHRSKIGKHIRFDNIVIRLINEKDAELLAEFVKSDPYIQDGLLPANPFAYNKEGLAYACDGNLSYNSTIAQYIWLYIESKKSTNSLNEINISDFYGYVANYYNTRIISSEVSDDEILQEMGQENRDKNLRNNYKQVTELILESSSRDFNYSNYLEHFRKNKLDNQKEYVNDANEHSNVIDLLKFAIIQSCSKYGPIDGLDRINAYLETGEINYITRNGNLRDVIFHSNFRQDILNSSIEVSYEELIFQAKKSILDDAIAATNSKYANYPTRSGKVFVVESLSSYITNGVPRRFTRDNNHRQILASCLSKDDLNNIIGRFTQEQIHDCDIYQGQYSMDILEQYVNESLRVQSKVL